jgi:hypothetical protein
MSKNEIPFCTTKVTIKKVYHDGETHSVSVSSTKIHIDDFREQLMQACLAFGWSEVQVNDIFNSSCED